MRYNEKNNRRPSGPISKLNLLCACFFAITGTVIAQGITFIGDSAYISPTNNGYHVTKLDFNYSYAGDNTYDMRGDSVIITVVRINGIIEKTALVNRVNPEDTTEYLFQLAFSSITPNVLFAPFQSNGDFSIYIGTIAPERFCKAIVEIFSRSKERYYLAPEKYVFSCRENPDNLMEFAVDEWGVRIDTFFINGPVFPKDSVYILIGTQENTGDIKIFRDLTEFNFTNSGIEGVRYVFTEDNDYKSGLIYLSVRDQEAFIRFVTIVIKREGAIVAHVSASVPVVTGTGVFASARLAYKSVIFQKTDMGGLLRNTSDRDLHVDFYSFTGHSHFQNKSIIKGEEIPISGQGIIIVRDNASGYLEKIKVP